MSEQHTINSSLDENRKFSASKEFSANAHIKSISEYKQLYGHSVKNPEQFWKEQSQLIHWFKPFNKVLEWNKPFCMWFLGGKTNVAYNCLDRHLDERRDKTALIFVPEPVIQHIMLYNPEAWFYYRTGRGHCLSSFFLARVWPIGFA